MKQGLSILLALLFFVLSFNAYACLLPTPDRDMAASSCPSSDNDAARQFCDAFKTLTLQSLPDSIGNDQRFISVLSLGHFDSVVSVCKKVAQDPTPTLSQILAVVTTTVLRI